MSKIIPSERIEQAMSIARFNPIGVYALFSHSLGALNVPFFCADDESAIRSVVELVVAARDASLLYGVLNGDLELHKVGTFDYSNLVAITPTLTAFNSDLVGRCVAVRKDLTKFIPQEESDG